MALNTSQLWGPVEPVIRKFFGLGAKSIKKVYNQIYDVSKGDEPIRHSMEMGGTGQLVRKTEGGSVTSMTVRQGVDKTWLYDIFAGRIELTFELARDAKVREIKKASSLLGRSIALTPEYQAAAGLDNAFDTTTTSVTADAKSWCSTTHTIVGTLGTGANRPSTDAALSETSLEDAYTSLLTIIGSDGMITQVMPEKLIVPAALAMTGKKLTIAGKTLGSANNDPKVVGDDLSLVVEPYCTNTKQWFIKTSYGADNLWWEWDIESEFFEDQVMTNLNKAYIALQRSRFGMDDWRILYGNSPS